jgi:hypothetical protein
MSMTKRSPHFDEMMEEQRRLDELSHDAYLSEHYLRTRIVKNADPGDEQVNPPKGTTR